MKRFNTQGDSPSKWKRIIGPVDDSDSSSSSSFDEIYGQHVCDFRACARCNRPAYGCKCSRLDSAGLVSNPQTSQFSGPLAMDSDQTIQDPGEAQAGPSGINTRRMSQSSSHLNENSEEPVSVSFRASTNIQAYKEQKFLDFFTKRRSFRLDVATERPMNGLLNPYLSRGSPYFVDRLAASEANDVAQCKDDPPVTNPSTNRASRNENTSESQENRPMDEESSAKAELEQLHAKLIGLLECPVCLEPIVPPIHQCRRGHLVCARCKSQLNQCPTCRDRMSDARNWAIERIAEQLRYPCKNSTSGCQVKMPLIQKEEHEAGCTFRLFACPFRTCSWTGFLPEMLPHLRGAHAARFLEGEFQQIDVELNSPTLFYTDWAISCLNEVFRLNVFQNIPNSMLYASCYYLGAPNRAADFTYTISLTGSQNRRITYTRQTHSESTKMSSLCTSSDCFLIKGDVVKYFVNDAKLALKVHIERSQ